MTPQPNATNWQPPDGLGYSSLRPVRLTRRGIVVAAAGVIFLIGGPVAGYSSAYQIKRDQRRDDRLAWQGVPSTAVITRVWRNSGKDERHLVSYRFTVEGSEWTGQVAVPPRIWTGLHSGAALPIRYVPGEPRINHPIEWPPSHEPNWLPWLTTGCFFLPAFLLLCLIQRQRRLLSEGRPAPGVVTRHRRTDKQVVVYYDFALLSGQVMKGKSSSGRRPPAVGSQVCVLYYPDNPRRSGLYPLPLVRLERS